MSRIGRQPIAIPSGVEVHIEKEVVKVKGPLGELTVPVAVGIFIEREDGVVSVKREGDARRVKALHGLTRALLANAVEGVSQGFRKELEIVGVGYRANLISPSELELSLGFSHPVRCKAPEGVSFELPAPTRIVVKGIDKQKVGQVAAEIRRLKPPEPYKGKGIKYVDEVILRKAGKTGK